jgi:hypothetical protein
MMKWFKSSAVLEQIIGASLVLIYTLLLKIFSAAGPITGEMMILK